MIKIKQYIYPNDFNTYQYWITNEQQELVIAGTGYDAYFNPEFEGLQLGEQIWGPNLIENEYCYELGIHALPGTRFLIGEGENNIIKINATGNFSMNFGNYPISSLRLAKEDASMYNLYPVIIDIVYQPMGEV